MKAFVVGILIFAFAFPAHAYAGCFVGGRRQAFRRNQIFYPVALYQVGAGLREQAIADEAARKAIEGYAARFTALEQRLLKFRGEATLRFEGEAETGATAEGGVDSPPPPEPQPGAGSGPADVLGIFAASCVKCHQASNAGGGLDLTLPVTDPGVAAKIFLRAFSDEPGFKMPKQGDITDEQRQVIYNWAQTIR